MPNDLNLQLVGIAKSFVGTEEEGGDNHGPMVERFQKAVDGVAKGEPWCAGFVAFCVMELESRTGIRSSIHLSESALEMWSKSSLLIRRTKPAPGLIVVWQRGTTWMGHTGIVSSIRSPEAFYTIEGNTNRGFEIEREGDGVFEKCRRIQGTKLFSLLGFLQPF